LKAALTNCDVRGVATNRDMHLALLDDVEFARGAVDTEYFQRFLERSRTAPSAARNPL
jgi:acetyl/propionyl-CoA carboxylase alpha subunit